MIRKYENFSINSIIGANTSVTGDIEADGFTRVDGNVRGDVTVKGRVVVGNAARLKGNISGTVITIGGVVYGNVLASEGLVILSTGLILGDVITRRIQADEGCLVHGKVVVCPTEESWTRAVSEHRDAQGIRSALSSFPSSYGQD
ncbi:cell shape determination protein CcmA [Spirochaetia bacterium]|nr:cell shape determination protein CcmA [Spirochaetia bacterium]